ncbi:hypothetical protein [Nostoc commune]|uniref:hypothetical protein n=1 Tax=Nostoc commune TaxID=1178 RepID=UPI0015E7F0F3|nr:hypothetical protein [Nostoc commune]
MKPTEVGFVCIAANSIRQDRRVFTFYDPIVLGDAYGGKLRAFHYTMILGDRSF